MGLNLVEDIHAVLAVNHSEGKSFFAKAPCAANPVKVCLVVSVPISVHGQIKVDHNRHLLHIDTWKSTQLHSPPNKRVDKTF